MAENDRLPPRGFFTVGVDDVGWLCEQVKAQLPAAAVLVWLLIRTFSWGNPPQFVEVPDEVFQGALGYSRQYVSKLLATLEEHGLIERKKRRLMRVVLAVVGEGKRKHLFTSTNVYVNTQHEEEEELYIDNPLLPVENGAQTSTNVYVGGMSTNGDVSRCDEVLEVVTRLFEQEIGGTVTLLVAEELRDLTQTCRDVEMWKATFRASVGKRSRWAWIKKVMASGGLRPQGGGRGRSGNGVGEGGKGAGSRGAGSGGEAERERRDREAAERLRRRGVDGV